MIRAAGGEIANFYDKSSRPSALVTVHGMIRFWNARRTEICGGGGSIADTPRVSTVAKHYRRTDHAASLSIQTWSRAAG